MKLTDFYELKIALNKVSDQTELLMKIYSVLKKDTVYHFLYEAGYLLVRGDKKYSGELEKLLHSMGMYVYIMEDKWIEQSEIVKRNIDYFYKLFHLNSDFAINKSMTMSKKDIIRFLERAVHTFILVNHMPLVKVYKSNIAESEILSKMAIERAFMDGIAVERYIRMRDEVK